MDDALPVSVDLVDPDLAADVRSHVESILGWQVVQPGPHLPVRLRLADAPDPGGPPTVVVCPAARADAGAVREALRAGALDVVAWPQDAHRLTAVVPRAAADRPAAHVVAVGGASHGVGTSTVALAVGALHAWAGRRTLVLTDAGGRRLTGSRAAAGRPTDVAGVPRLRVASDLPAGTDPPAEVLVADRGVSHRATVLVGRPDAALVAALADPDARGAVVVTVGEGGLRAAELARLVGDRLHIPLPWSFRVARAGLLGRIPGGLPGRHLAALAPAVRTWQPPLPATPAADTRHGRRAA